MTQRFGRSAVAAGARPILRSSTVTDVRAKGVGIAASEYRQSVPEESSVRVLEAMLGCMAHLKDRYA